MGPKGAYSPPSSSPKCDFLHRLLDSFLDHSEQETGTEHCQHLLKISGHHLTNIAPVCGQLFIKTQPE